jgi:hypothetical protein
MSRTAQKATASPDQVRTAVCGRLQARRAEIEQAALTRVYAVSAPTESADPEYAAGLRTAVSAALDYWIAAIERGEERAPPFPAALLVQARLAARNGVSLDTVLRRYFAGFTLLGDLLIGEAEEYGSVRGAELKRLMRTPAALFDRLIAAVTEAYTDAAESRLISAEERRAERIERLLAGELLDTKEFGYDFEAHNLGVIVAGPAAMEAIRILATAVDRRLLMVRRDEETVWVWMGGRREFHREEIESLASRSWPEGVSLALGEPADGITGWRLTHRQAKAALPIALRGSEVVVRYADIALAASTLQDDLLTTSLRTLYLEPLASDRDGGKTARQTLRAYFAAGRNASSTAALLGVSRRTVANRLHAIEERFGRPLGAAVAEIEVALQIEELDGGITDAERVREAPFLIE